MARLNEGTEVECEAALTVGALSGSRHNDQSAAIVVVVLLQ